MSASASFPAGTWELVDVVTHGARVLPWTNVQSRRVEADGAAAGAGPRTVLVEHNAMRSAEANSREFE